MHSAIIRSKTVLFLWKGFMLHLWVICQSLHTYKIHKNKIHSNNNNILTICILIYPTDKKSWLITHANCICLENFCTSVLDNVPYDISSDQPMYVLSLIWLFLLISRAKGPGFLKWTAKVLVIDCDNCEHSEKRINPVRRCIHFP